MLYEYECRACKHIFKVICRPGERDNQVCEKCSGRVDRFIGCPSIVGTRDNFGIKNEFRDETTGKTVDTWRKWEKAGYRNPIETTQDHQVKEKIKENIKKRKNK